ncbi:MAG: leucine-rich repeat protein [Clostridia bacterium]|nr:leucine-rich repeat protein [Clostridia bacterium]
MRTRTRSLLFIFVFAAILCSCLLVSGAVGAKPQSGETAAQTCVGQKTDAAEAGGLQEPKVCMTGRESGPGCKSKVFDLVTLDDIPVRSPALIGGKSFAPSLTKADKNLPLVIIVAGFEDVAYEDGFDWAQEIFKTEYSLSQYYTDMSFGQFTFVPAVESSAFGTDGNTNAADAANDGIIHVTLPMKHDNWIDLAEGTPEEVTLVQMVAGAIEAADDYIDFASYDADGDGVIANNELALGLVVAGYEASASDSFKLGEKNYLWAHAWDIAEYPDVPSPTVDGVSVTAYIAISEQMEDNDDIIQEPISVLAHELGHYLGLPDLYDVYYLEGEPWSGYSCYCLSVMDSGSWGVTEDGGYRPYSMDAWSRSILGWFDPMVAEADGEFSVNAQSSGEFSALRIPTLVDGEYYLLENREFTGWDEGLAIDYSGGGGIIIVMDDVGDDYTYDSDETGEEIVGEEPEDITSGIIIWHIDDNVYDEYNDSNEVNTCNHRPAVMPVYPESDNSGNVTFIGSAPDFYSPFFNSTVWAEKYAPTLGDSLDLPLYNGAVYPYQRVLSGTKLSFLDPEGAKLNVAVELSTEMPEPYDAFVPDLSDDPSVVAYGACGPAVWWKLSTEGVLTIAGEGDMFDYAGYFPDYDEEGNELETGSSDVPWFDYADSIVSGVVEDGVTSIGSCTFERCGNLADVDIADSVAYIGEYSFMYCESLQSVEIPENVPIILRAVFYGSGIKEITIPAGVWFIEDYAFGECYELSDVYFAGTKDDWDVLTDGIDFTNDRLFAATVHCSDGDVRVMPDFSEVGGIVCSGICGRNAWWSLDEAGKLTIGGSGEMFEYQGYDYTYGVSDIPWFDYADSIVSGEVLDGVTNVASGTFELCGNVASVTLPAGLERIEYYAFDECGSLATVNYGGTKSDFDALDINSYGNDSLFAAQIICSDGEWSPVPDLSGDASVVDYGRCGGAAWWQLSTDGVLTISGKGKMYDYYGWDPETETSDVPWFDHADDITAAVIEEGIVTVGACAFEKCTNLKTVEIPSTISAIGNYAFFETAITEITLPYWLGEVGYRAFYGCGSLANVTYMGSEEMWEGYIYIDEGNEPLLEAELFCADRMPLPEEEHDVVFWLDAPLSAVPGETFTLAVNGRWIDRLVSADLVLFFDADVLEYVPDSLSVFSGGTASYDPETGALLLGYDEPLAQEEDGAVLSLDFTVREGVYGYTGFDFDCDSATLSDDDWMSMTVVSVGVTIVSEDGPGEDPGEDPEPEVITVTNEKGDFTIEYYADALPEGAQAEITDLTGGQFAWAAYNDFPYNDLRVVASRFVADEEECAPESDSVTMTVAVPESFNPENLAVYEMSPDGLNSVGFEYDAEKGAVVFAAGAGGFIIVDTTNVYENAFELGDIDGDGQVTAADARLALRTSVGLEARAPRSDVAADTDYDGDVTPADARAILRHVIGLEELRLPFGD